MQQLVWNTANIGITAAAAIANVAEKTKLQNGYQSMPGVTSVMRKQFNFTKKNDFLNELKPGADTQSSDSDSESDGSSSESDPPTPKASQMKATNQSPATPSPIRTWDDDAGNFDFSKPPSTPLVKVAETAVETVVETAVEAAETAEGTEFTQETPKCKKRVRSSATYSGLAGKRLRSQKD